jgi:putative ABC transport system permease protein
MPISRVRVATTNDRTLALGFAAGVVCTWLWDRFFSSANADVKATDPRVVTLVAATLVVFGILACVAPALRAMRLDPVTAIRRD